MCATRSSEETTVTAPSQLTFTVSVVMERRVISRNGWSLPQWQLSGVMSEQSAEHPAATNSIRQRIRQSDASEHYLWSGFCFSLYKDSAEQYWHGLIGDQPALYVVCREDEDSELAPALVTLDYDEAGAYVEADDKVFSHPIPADIYKAMELFVLDNYAPKEKKARKRKTWKKPGGGDEAFAYRPKI